MTLDLRSIRLRDGRSYPFDGIIEDIRTPDGDTVRVDREGTVDTSDDRTRKTVERGAIGAALGAVIGAVAGGGKGAAIGAVIGAGGGAGTVFIGERDRLDLPRGTEFTITSGGPRNQRPIPSAWLPGGWRGGVTLSWSMTQQNASRTSGRPSVVEVTAPESRLAPRWRSGR